VQVVTSARGQEVLVEGRLDVRVAADLRLDLHAAIADGVGDLYLHLDNAELSDATALAVLLECHRRARREGRRLVLASLTPRTARLLRASRLDRVLHVASAVAPLSA
jgi:anti-anti-sigma factor